MTRTLKILDGLTGICLIVFVLFSMFSISVTQIALGLGALVWLARTQLTGSWKDQQWPLGIPFLVFSLACLLAVLTAVDPAVSLKPLKKLLLILTVFWVANTVQGARQRDLLVLLLVISACGASLYGFYQAFTTSVTLKTRVEGTMSIYMTFAGLLMLVGLLSLARFLFRKPREPGMGLAAGLILICLLLTLTRQAWIGFLAGGLFLVYCWRPKLLWAVPVLLALVLWLAPAPVADRITSMVDWNNRTFQTRLALWQGGWEIFKDHPLTGCGFKCVDVVHTQYPDPTGYIERYIGMHNNFVQLAVDTGLIGLGAWMAIWICFFRRMVRETISGIRPDGERWVILGPVAAALGFLSAGLFEVNFYDSEVVMVLYFILALPFSARTPSPA